MARLKNQEGKGASLKMTLQELSQLYYLKQEIERDKLRLEELKTKAYSIPGSNFAGIPGCGSFIESNIGRYSDAIADLEALIKAKIQQCLCERDRLERYIADIPDSLTRQIFTERFVNGLTWVQVALRIGGYNTADSVRMICKRYISKENEKKRG